MRASYTAPVSDGNRRVVSPPSIELTQTPLTFAAPDAWQHVPAVWQEHGKPRLSGRPPTGRWASPRHRRPARGGALPDRC